LDIAAFLATLGPFGAGVLSAASPCLLPLYPGFIAYLGSNATALEGRRATGLLGLIVLLGVLSTMIMAGVLLVAIAVPTSRLLAYATPLVDGLLVVLGALLLAGHNPFNRLPGMRVPVLASPYAQAYVYGMLLGPLALPCAGPFLVSLLGISLGVADAVGKVGTFVVFGLGFGLPLVLLSLLTSVRSRELVHLIVAHHRAIEAISGVVLIALGIVDFADKWPSVRLTLGV
jgi:cytochrome c-type biogenesis protein